MKTNIRSKQDMVSVCSILLTELRPWMDKAGIKQTALTITSDWEHLPMNMVREGWNWLKVVHNINLAEITKVRSLLNEDLWEKYENWGGFDDLREVQMMNEALIRLKKKVTNNDRPDFFKKTRVTKIIRKKNKEAKAKAKADNARRGRGKS
ncbi:MAG: hypothetical protein QQN63_02245 [Nitrosopumilus sp.]